MNKTLFNYIFKMQFKATVFVSFFVFCLIFLFDFAEITRKFPISSLNETMFAIKISFLKVPVTFCEIMHYIYFITATFSLWSLCNSNQIMILKSTGKSPQQILFPFVSFAFFMAMVWLFVAHPLGKISNESYAKKTQHSVNYNVNENIWIDYIKENQIIFIGKIIEKKMSNLHIFDLKQNKKIFAEHAVIGDKTWTLNNITIIDQKDNSITNVNDMAIPNNVSIDLIKILAKQPKNHNIYQLKKVYDIQKQDQVVLRPYELELHKLLSNCANFILFALMAAIICFPINRYKTKTSIAAKVIMTSIILRFANNMFESLAHSGVLSVKLASWAVVAIMLCVATAMLIWKEA